MYVGPITPYGYFQHSEKQPGFYDSACGVWAKNSLMKDMATMEIGNKLQTKTFILPTYLQTNYGLEMAAIVTTHTNREENFLQAYFNGLAQSSFDKCKDTVVCVLIPFYSKS